MWGEHECEMSRAIISPDSRLLTTSWSPTGDDYAISYLAQRQSFWDSFVCEGMKLKGSRTKDDEAYFTQNRPDVFAPHKEPKIGNNVREISSKLVPTFVLNFYFRRVGLVARGLRRPKWNGRRRRRKKVLGSSTNRSQNPGSESLKSHFQKYLRASKAEIQRFHYFDTILSSPFSAHPETGQVLLFIYSISLGHCWEVSLSS
jgi:hypothetical protein